MQNVVNLHSPFLVGGNPIVNGRVYFVKVGTDAQTFNQVAGLDDAFFITVYDKDGHALENPLPLDSEGCFSVQPFVEDGADFKMIVCRPTGISPDLEDDTVAWAVAYTMVSKSQQITVSYEGIAVCDSLTELRQLDAGVGTVLVLGYGSANDFCPPRIFTWKPTALTDNGGTHIRSLKQGQQNAGTWICEPQGYVDVRWFGVEPGTAAGNTDCWTTVNAIVSNYYPDLPVYFPKGYYRLSENLAVDSAMILDNGAYIRPYNKSVTVTINRLENRGGVFQRAALADGETEYNVYPKVKGVLYSSWMSHPGEQISNDMLANVTELVVDSNTDFGTDYTLSQKRILLKKGVTLLHVVFDKCQVYYEETSILDIAALLVGRIGVDSKVSISAETAHNENGLVVNVFENANLVKVLEIFKSMATLFAGLKLEYLLVGEADGEEFQNGCYENPDVFEGALSLIFKYGYFKELLYTKDLNIGGGVSHAKSVRSLVLLTINEVEEGGVTQLQMNVKKDGVEVGTCNPVSTKTFSLRDSVFDFFADSRDFDILVTTTVAIKTNSLLLILPSSFEDEEKIFSISYEPLKETNLYNDSNMPLQLRVVTDTPGVYESVKYMGQESVYEVGYTSYDNGFFGNRVVRKAAGGNWFFDPFAI